LPTPLNLVYATNRDGSEMSEGIMSDEFDSLS